MIQPDARRCKHCQAILDPSLRNAEDDSRRQRQRSRRYDDYDNNYREPPRPKKRRSILWTIIAVVIGIGVIGAVVTLKARREALQDANNAWDAGRFDEAVALYEKGYPAAASEKAPIIKRVVDHHMKSGKTTEARKWIEKGLDDRLTLTFESGPAMALLGQIQREREDRIAKAKHKPAPIELDGGKDTTPSPRPKDKGSKVTRENYERIEVGMTYDEVADILGHGKERSQIDDFVTMEWTAGAFRLRGISITFERGRVFSKLILD